VLRNHPSFPDPELAPERDALNCIRVLTRILPFVYEAEHLEDWEETFFWGARRRRTRHSKITKSEVLFDGNGEDTPDNNEPEFEQVKPLAEELIDTLTDLLFFSDFTLPKAPTGKSKVTYAIWQSGVGCHTPVISTKEYENNRAEILRLLLVMCSKAMYMTPQILPAKGVRAISYITMCPDKQIVLSTLCSLLNTTLKYNPAAWRVPYDHMVIKDNKQLLVTYCLHFLLVLVLYPIPETQHGVTPKNYFRHFLGRLHRPQDFQFLVDGMNRILNQPLQASTSYLPGSQKSLAWAPEMLMLFWEALQCNKRFRSFIIDTDRAHDFVILVLFYAMEGKNDPNKQGLVRMCVFILQTMSVEPNFGKSLNKRFEGQDTLPLNIRIQNFHGTYADYLITSIYNLLTSGKGNLEAVYPALLAIINNIMPYLENLGRATSSKLLSLFASMSSPSFLFANETNYSLLISLLEALNAIIEHQFNKNPNVVYAVIRSQKRFENLRNFTLESAQEELERQKTEAAAADQPPHSRNSSGDLRSPLSARSPSLSNVPEEQSAFTIGDDDDSDGDEASASQPLQRRTTSPSSTAASSSSAAAPPDTLPTQLRGMSEKARGKQRAGAPSFSRQNSVSSLASLTPAASGAAPGLAFQPSAEWVEAWRTELPLHSVLALVAALGPAVAAARDDDAALAALRRASPPAGLERSPVRIHLFEWSPLALGWYESLLWGFVFTSELAYSKGSAGVWNATMVRLFRVCGAVARVSLMDANL